MESIYFASFPLSPNAELTSIFGVDGKPVFDFVSNNVDEVFAHRICAKLNGDNSVCFTHAWEAQEESLAYDGLRILDLCGWGVLTEEHNLTGREAEWEQEEFLIWCAERLADSC